MQYKKLKANMKTILGMQNYAIPFTISSCRSYAKR